MNRIISALVVVSCVAGCRPSAVTVEEVAPGTDCPAGGLRLFNNGKDPQLFCNGTPGATGAAGTAGTNGAVGVDGGPGGVALVVQNPIPRGDTRCVAGGTEVTSGLDTNGDGTLEASEVTATSAVCAADDNARVGSLVPPAGPPGTGVMNLRGGASDGGLGGNGGNLGFLMNEGTNGGHLKVWRTGVADAGFVVPTPPAPELGLVPLVVTTDTVVAFNATPAALDAGTPFVGFGGLLLSLGPNLPPQAITGLTVASGVKLTLPIGRGSFRIPGSCRIDGTLLPDLSAAGETNTLVLSCGDVVLGTSSVVQFGGVPPDSAAGLNLEATRGSLLALGRIDTSGATSTTAPTNGASVRLTAHHELFTQGSIKTSGNSGAVVSSQAAAGNITLISSGNLFNGATLEANAGTLDALTPVPSMRGSSGGQVSLLVQDSRAVLRNHGAISANGGGLVAANCLSCTGGSGGSITLSASPAGLLNDAPLSAHGAPALTVGGEGGLIQFDSGTRSDGLGVPGSMVVSGDLDVSGGDGQTGGQAGALNAYGGSLSTGAEMVFLGYARIDANGGAGGTGGFGGYVSLQQNTAQTSSGPTRAAGAVVLAADVEARGGQTRSAVFDTHNPSGGHVQLNSQTVLDPIGADWEVVLQTGSIDVSGGGDGQGGTYGNGGSIDMFGRAGITSSGALTALGGGSINFMSYAAPVRTSGVIDVSGGVSAEPVGLNAGSVHLRGSTVTVSGRILAAGGNANAASGLGGDGGGIFLLSTGGQPSNITAAAPMGLVVSGGLGNVTGVLGGVFIDGFTDTNHWTH